MKFYQTALATFVVFLFGTTCIAQENKTIIKGLVHNWPTDTVYLKTMPFHSPHSSKLQFKTISKDSTFSFEFGGTKKPVIVQLFANKTDIKLNEEQLLFQNLTEDYYYGHCVKFYTYGKSTFLIEPNKVINVDLTSNRYSSTLTKEKANKYRKLGAKIPETNIVENVNRTDIKFNGKDTFQNEYYQKSFDLDDKIDKRLDLYKTRPIEDAIVGFKKIRQKLLDELESNKDKLSTVFYDYIKAEIEFGARNEFIKYLVFARKEDMSAFFSNSIAPEIIDIIEFDKTHVNNTTLISEEYNKYIEMYLNFKLNNANKKYVDYYKFTMQKIRTAIRNLPNESIYYYLANNLMQTNRTELMQSINNEDAVEELITKIISKYPNGELNDKLMIQYDL